jgi:hypothetical protein
MPHLCRKIVRQTQPAPRPALQLQKPLMIRKEGDSTPDDPGPALPTRVGLFGRNSAPLRGWSRYEALRSGEQLGDTPSGSADLQASVLAHWAYPGKRLSS